MKIEKYFAKGYSLQMILHLLRTNWNINISRRTFSRILNMLNLKRKNINESPYAELVTAILLELEGSGFNLGYRAMWKRLKKVYNLTAKQETIRILLGGIDPDGVEGRRRYRLKRRVYSAPGPNHIWHADNHDKLKRFGFPIYGCIDGFSKKVIWLRVSRTNNNPNVIGSYYLTAIEKHGFLPTLVRADNGTEATLMEDMHMALRYHHDDECAGIKSFIRGKSTRNQRIESYWRQFRQHMGEFYMQLFKTMEEENLFRADSPLHIECLRYCFGKLIQDDMELTRKEWNEHRIRKQNNRDVAGGIPDEMFKWPENYGAVRCEKQLDLESLQCLKEYVEEPILISPVFNELVKLLDIRISEVVTAEDAFNLYLTILRAISSELGEVDVLLL
ncbi:uncharacterized protein LOC127287539 [Leptopilina boulardi]|uniref:uncharacterized protein LOC127287539 n=1 Tax=Leptopilina boulardi TaxID=63433 RepID=UPI0021F5574C|nr:uncharacterized protein LOC127287539 [Leptopilina boulardi]